jgi:hypothetical protein
VAGIAAVASLLASTAPGASQQARAHFRCPAVLAAMSSGSNAKRSALLPGSPSTLVLCRYGPLPSQMLVARKVLNNRRQVGRVVRGLNALPSLPAGPIACPADNGSSILVFAFYKSAPERIVRVDLSGCLVAKRGAIARWDIPSRGQFVRALERLTSA